MRKLIVSLLLAGCAALIVYGETQSRLREVFSPDKRFSVKITDTALPGADPYTGFFTLVLEAQGKVLSKYPTTGYLLNAFWNASGTLVAVNNRRGISGDYVWILALKDGDALKRPDDTEASAMAEKASKRYPECNPRALDGSLTEALGWTSPNELVVRTRLLFDKKRIALDRIAVYQIADDRLALVRETFERIQWPPTPGVTPTYYTSPVPAEVFRQGK